MTTLKSSGAAPIAWSPGPERRFVRSAGAVCLVSGVVGLIAGAVLAVVPSHVSDDRYSYPLTPGPFVAFQILFALQHALLLVGLLGLRRSRAAGAGRLGRVGLAVAFLGMAGLTVVELAAISLSHSAESGSSADVFGSLYGITSLMAGLGLVLIGVAIIRAGFWVGWARTIALAAGAYVFVVMTPAGFGPVRIMSLAIGFWMLLWALIGRAMTKSARNDLLTADL